MKDDTARPILDSPANEVMARLSPDGRWLAYTSDESGAWEVYVQPFPDGAGKWQVSTGGGSQPFWRGVAPFRSGYAVSPDGQRFLLNNVVPNAEPSAITIVRHWTAGLDAQAPGQD